MSSKPPRVERQQAVRISTAQVEPEGTARTGLDRTGLDRTEEAITVKFGRCLWRQLSEEKRRKREEASNCEN